MSQQVAPPDTFRGERRFSIVAMTASVGGVIALREVLGALPADFPAPIVVVQHLSPRQPSLLAGILDRRSPLRVREAANGTRLEAGSVYLAPPDHHVLVNPNGTLGLSQAAKVQFVRPSADLLFESVAATHGDGALAVVLTGTGRDGASGSVAIKRLGGTVIAQNRETSRSFGMPGAALQTGSVDFVLPLSSIPAALIALVMVPGAAALFGVPNRAESRA